MKSIFFVFILFISVVSCKHKDTKMYDYSQDFNKKEIQLQDTSLIQAKAFFNKNSVNIDFILKSKAAEAKELEINTVSPILLHYLEKMPEGKDIIKEGGILNVRLFNQFGIKITEFTLKDYSTTDIVLN